MPLAARQQPLYARSVCVRRQGLFRFVAGSIAEDTGSHDIVAGVATTGLSREKVLGSALENAQSGRFSG